jgi:hypothetical protein
MIARLVGLVNFLQLDSLILFLVLSGISMLVYLGSYLIVSATLSEGLLIQDILYHVLQWREIVYSGLKEAIKQGRIYW